MALFCTCGAELPDDARFCLRCGRPLRTQDQPLVEQIRPPAPAVSAPAISFGNPFAVRVALLCASISGMLSVIPFINFGCCLWMLGSGFFSVLLYSRRTGLMLSVGDGVRMGWITGLFTFVIGIAFTSLAFVTTRSSGGFRETLRQVLEKLPAQDETSRQMVQFMSSPGGLALFLLVYIAMAFILVVSLAIAGGALGAKVLEKE